MKQNRHLADGSRIGVKGFFRVQITEDNQIVGDSGMLQNQVTNDGVSKYLADLLGQSADSLQISRMALGTGGAPASIASLLPGEVGTGEYTRTTVTYANVGSFTARFTATWASSDSHFSTTHNISNIAILNDTTSAGTIMAGQTYASSLLNTNQDVNATYEIRFSTA